jgi:hypothetical protein
MCLAMEVIIGLQYLHFVYRSSSLVEDKRYFVLNCKSIIFLFTLWRHFENKKRRIVTSSCFTSFTNLLRNGSLNTFLRQRIYLSDKVFSMRWKKNGKVVLSRTSCYMLLHSVVRYQTFEKPGVFTELENQSQGNKVHEWGFHSSVSV